MDLAINSGDKQLILLLLQKVPMSVKDFKNGLDYVLARFEYDTDLDMLVKCEHSKLYASTYGSTVFTAFLEVCSDKNFNVAPAKAIEAINKFRASKNFDIKQPQHLLALAMDKCSTDVCRHLVNAGADVNSGYKQGKQAVHVAIESNSNGKLKLILEQPEFHCRPWIKKVGAITYLEFYMLIFSKMFIATVTYYQISFHVSGGNRLYWYHVHEVFEELSAVNTPSLFKSKRV